MIPQRINLINIYGGPGCGKSTVAAGLFVKLKMRGYPTELVTEYAKDLIYDGHAEMIRNRMNQLQILEEQFRRQTRLIGHGIDWIITDSPILLPLYYVSKNDPDYDVVVQRTKKYAADSTFKNHNFLLHRPDTYQQYGRVQTFDEAKQIDIDMRAILDEIGLGYVPVQANEHVVDHILGFVDPQPAPIPGTTTWV